MPSGGGEVWGDTHADQGPGGAVVVTRGFAHGLVVIHGHSESQRQEMAGLDPPAPALPQGVAAVSFTQMPDRQFRG